MNHLITPLRVAIVGAGPSGIYAAQALLDEAPRRGLPTPAIDLYDQLPAPFGLVRYGVAPDHSSIKAIASTLARTLEHPAVRFVGSLRLGSSQLQRPQMQRAYHAVIYTTGCSGETTLGIPGEALGGVWSSRQFVSWYNSHPDSPSISLGQARSAAVIGLGNVALDVARLLLSDAERLRATDLSEPVLHELTHHQIRDVWLIGRRGPQHAAFTTKELRELLHLPGVQVDVQPSEVLELAGDPTWDRRVSGNVAALSGVGASPRSTNPPPQPRARLHCVFFHRPVHLQGSHSGVVGLQVERTQLDPSGTLVGTGQLLHVPAQLVVSAVGYRGLPLVDLPFDERTGTLRHEQGRVGPGEYVAGWAKRGAHGVVGTNKSDACATVSTLLDDLASTDLPTPEPGLADQLAQQGTTYADWQRLDAAERALGASRGCQRVTLPGPEQRREARSAA